MARSMVIVGGGPRGTGVLERLAASAPEYGVDAEHPLDVHLVDPYPPGAGRIWRTAQSELLWMNSMAADVTMYTDDSVTCTGPIVPGPSLIEWAEQVRAGELDGETVPDGRVGDELRGLRPNTFPTRQLQSHYLDFVLRRVLATLPDGLRVHLHCGRAAGVVDGDVRRVRIEESDGTSVEIDTDVVLLASGHLDATPSDDETALVEASRRLGLQYFPPEQTTDSDLDAIAPGRTVIARGMGLAFVDLMVLLYEGRGGRFVEVPAGEGDGADDDGSGRGRLEYVPSGREVYLQVGSGRGVPYHAKTEYTLRGPRPPLPRFFGADQVEELLARGEVSLRDEVWPLIAKEVGWGWYHELHHGHPGRVTTTWEDFAERYAAVDWYSAEREELVAEAVPAASDRLDFERLDRPLDGVFADLDTLQKHLREYVADDLARHVDPAHTAELGAFTALLSAYMTSSELASRGGLTPRSRAFDLSWWQNLFSSMASGPPGPRLRQLLALSRAGYVTFLGASVRVDIDDRTREFVATGSSLQGEVRAPTFVDARLASPSVRRSLDPMLASLTRHGVLDEETLRFEERATPCSLDAVAERVDWRDTPVVVHSTGLVPVRASDFRVLTGADEEPHPRLFAVGPHTTVRLPGAFTRPRTNSLSFRANDACAQAMLATATGR